MYVSLSLSIYIYIYTYMYIYIYTHLSLSIYIYIYIYTYITRMYLIMCEVICYAHDGSFTYPPRWARRYFKLYCTSYTLYYIIL